MYLCVSIERQLFGEGGILVRARTLLFRRIVANFLTTNPISYAYYLMVLGGVVWNALGSGWVSVAFRDYNHAFGVCYLVCIVLSWVSTIVSPSFVFAGTC